VDEKVGVGKKSWFSHYVIPVRGIKLFSIESKFHLLHDCGLEACNLSEEVTCTYRS